MNMISHLGLAPRLSAVGLFAASLLGLTVSDSATDGLTGDLSAAISEGKSSMNFRYRFEGVVRTASMKMRLRRPCGLVYLCIRVNIGFFDGSGNRLRQCDWS